MSDEAVKGNEHIHSNPEAFQESYRRAREAFRKIDGVAGVGVGLKQSGGAYRDEIAILVYVGEKKPEEALAPEERIPPAFDGYRTDVMVVERGVAQGCDNVTKYDHIQGGIQIMGRRSGGDTFKGTLGCIVRKRADAGRENVHLLTNKHVLYSPNFGANQSVFHPTPDDEALGPVLRDYAAYGNVPWPPDAAAPEDVFVDCAIARIDLDSTCCGSTCTHDTTHVDETSIVDLQVNGVNTLSDVRNLLLEADPTDIISTAATPRKVFKVGRSTGKTTGKVLAIHAPLLAHPEPELGGPKIHAVNLIQIEFDVTSTENGKNSCDNRLFTDDGDSGSIIVDESNRVIGIHTHGGTVAADDGLIPSFACHIVPVLDTLGICIPVTTGTSHGSSLATDGSGAVPVPTSSADTPDGQFVFADEAAAAAWPEPVAVSDDEERHMRGLLEALRTTRKGRELHELFGHLRREVGYLVRNHKLVKVAWHRNKGPAFMAHVLHHLKGTNATVPREVEGVSAVTLLTRMAEVLKAYGSNPLREAIEEHSAEALELLASGECNTAGECIDWLKRREAA